jgi:hypothetical protein
VTGGIGFFTVSFRESIISLSRAKTGDGKVFDLVHISRTFFVFSFASALSSAIMSWNRPSKTPSTLSRKVAAFPVLEFMSPMIPRFVA